MLITVKKEDIVPIEQDAEFRKFTCSLHLCLWYFCEPLGKA